MAKISCVMPTRNREKTIVEAIQSIVDQTETDWELIIVDDHSDKDDKTELLTSSFSDKRIKYFKLKDENGIGIAAARNFGNAIAKADFIAVMDSDDIAYPERFELLLETMKKTKADVCYGDINYWYPESDKIEYYKSRPFNLADFKRYDFIPHGSSCYKRDIAIRYPYNSFFKKAEDYDFFARLYADNFKFEYINKPLIKYRKHPDSITAKKDEEIDYPQIVKQNLERWMIKN